MIQVGDGDSVVIEELIRNKDQMYDLLSSGRLGNTIPQWFSLSAWQTDPIARHYRVWGVRTLTPGGPCRLYCPEDEVATTVEEYESNGHACNISVMIDAITEVTLYADVFDSDTGITVYAVENPGKGASWRKVMPTLGRQYEGLVAKMLLRKHLDPSSLADLEALLERYPKHVVELSACSTCFGTVPGRNAVIWEVRTATGEYERSSWGNW